MGSECVGSECVGSECVGSEYVGSEWAVSVWVVSVCDGLTSVVVLAETSLTVLLRPEIRFTTVLPM